MAVNQKHRNEQYVMPSREQIIRTVATSTAIETGQSSSMIASSLDEQRDKFAYLSLAVHPPVSA
ncbi:MULTISPECIES: hypothetical protein [Dickeya]|uniref:Uncharacterized protein n=1 Tax=Dickeya fangzhongdai TaxID=1778540 RepID=A0A2K8QSH2_9GAMM|nr:MULTISPECIES: hypothetical protein [Dickeya]ATZ95700.1 hypothetical protein CVE23_18040 [Dickeya fangzhongdai]QOH49145.1 hypothetical protein DYD82_18115 [Dickeya fangzhongdai]QOH53448.1 hypothetical protein DYD83_18115 [Dickeya fangzhongdai]UMB76069.1 hypothetical protein FXN80_18640 [Dickeya fangzhongdai]WOX99349.1 hypothetical protein OGM22_17135 [Dickeya fangzhongdai]